MDSVSATVKALNWQAINSKDIDRERDDAENLEFCDEREFEFRRKCKKAKADVRELERQIKGLEAIVERTKRLRRTEIDYWEDGDLEFWISCMGKNFVFIFSKFPYEYIFWKNYQPGEGWHYNGNTGYYTHASVGTRYFSLSFMLLILS